jgi:hypothetical protein
MLLSAQVGRRRCLSNSSAIPSWTAVHVHVHVFVRVHSQCVRVYVCVCECVCVCVCVRVCAPLHFCPPRTFIEAEWSMQQPRHFCEESHVSFPAWLRGVPGVPGVPVGLSHVGPVCCLQVASVHLS